MYSSSQAICFQNKSLVASHFFFTDENVVSFDTFQMAV